MSSKPTLFVEPANNLSKAWIAAAVGARSSTPPEASCSDGSKLAGMSTSKQPDGLPSARLRAFWRTLCNVGIFLKRCVDDLAWKQVQGRHTPVVSKFCLAVKVKVGRTKQSGITVCDRKNAYQLVHCTRPCIRHAPCTHGIW